MIGSATCTNRPRSFCDCSVASSEIDLSWRNRMEYRLLPLVLLALICACPVAASAASNEASIAPTVMLISVDGMKPESIIDAQRHHLKVPNLRAFMTDGVYATGVRGVLPTLTYPSHTTLLTGASPAKHGIYGNTTFD